MLIVRLKQSELALSDGRLDEAFDLARQPDFRGHRQGQELIGRLVRALVERGRQHLAAGRLPQAAADCEKAAQLGGNLTDVAQLRSAVSNAMRKCDQADRQIGQAVAFARRHADQGQMTVGQQLLDAVEPPDARVDGLKQDLAARRAGLESRLKRASEALSTRDWTTAVDLLIGIDRGAANDAGLRQLCGKISQHVNSEMRREFEAGRLNIAWALLARLDSLPVQNVDTDHLRKTLDQCRLAYSAIEAGEPHKALDVLRRLHSLWPQAGWLAEAADQAKQLGDAFSKIRGSPLYLVGMFSRQEVKTPGRIAAPPLPLPPPLPQAGESGAQSFCLHVDGIGSFQVFTKSALSIGPAGSSRSVDIPLMLDANVPTVTVLRSDEDYFLRSRQPVLINQTQAVNKLLNDGDQIGMGKRCRIRFRRPSEASASAVLDLSGARLAASTVRQVLLLDREIIIGPGSTAHIRVDDLAAPVVLQKRGAGLLCRSAGQIAINDTPAGTMAEILENAPISIGSLRFVVVREPGP